MKLKLTLFITLAGAMLACQNPEASNETADTNDSTAVASTDQTDELKKNTGEQSHKFIVGKWIGEMDGAKLLIAIDRVTRDSVFGHYDAGNGSRELQGAISKSEWDQACSYAYESILAEDSTDGFSGAFNLKFVGYQEMVEKKGSSKCYGPIYHAECVGEWGAYNGKQLSSLTLEQKADR